MQDWQPWHSDSFRFSAEDEVHVWRVPLHISQDFLHALTALLSTDEKERAARFKFEKHRKNFISARGQLRLLLAAYTGQSPDKLRFTYNRFGKPSLISDGTLPQICFNISHSHELALMAFHPRWELGTDIEWMKPDFDGLHLVHRFFSQNEIEQINALPDHLKREAFFNGWTRKEAYIKARGRGLNIPLHRFSVRLTPGEPAALLETSHDPRAVKEWSLQDIPIDTGYKAALVVHAISFRLKQWLGEHLRQLL
jgi:4'-phosphopantetheinyl transferase